MAKWHPTSRQESWPDRWSVPCLKGPLPGSPVLTIAASHSPFILCLRGNLHRFPYKLCSLAKLYFPSYHRRVRVIAMSVNVITVINAFVIRLVPGRSRQPVSDASGRTKGRGRHRDTSHWCSRRGRWRLQAAQQLGVQSWRPK